MGATKNYFKFITGISKLFGVFPVSRNDKKIVFQWYSIHTFCFLTSFLFSFTFLIFNIRENLLGYVLIALDASGIVAQLSFFIMAMNWSKLMNDCDRIDFYMKSYGFPKHLKLKLQVLCVALTVLCLIIAVVYGLFNVGLSEHPLYETYTFIGVWRTTVRSVKEGVSFAEGGKLLFIFVLQLSHWRIAMLRCYVDIFIITVSVILTARLRQIVERIDLLIKRRVRDQDVWMRASEDYQRLCTFCEKWDDVLGYLVLPSFASNIYILLVHIQGALTHSGTIDMLFTTSACLESLIRCMLVCYAAGNVYEESRRLLRILLLTPSDLFNDEIERMLLKMRQGQPALTGKQLFTVKHSLILQVLGCIATHEIIILQYYSSGVRDEK